MTTLNKYAADILHNYPVHACTDVTGFGLSGHLLEMVGNDFSAEIYADKLPIIDEALDYAEEFLTTGGGQKNRNHAGERIHFAENITFGMEEIIFDPQTSGGLLVAIPADVSEELAQKLNCNIIGKINKASDIKIYVK